MRVGAKIKPAFCDVWSVGILSIELSDEVLVELDCSFLDGEVITFGIPQCQWSQSQEALWLIRMMGIYQYNVCGTIDYILRRG